MPKLKVDLIVDDKGSLVVKNFTNKTSQYMHSAAGSVGGLVSKLTSLQGLMIAGGLGLTAKGFLDTASSFEQMEKKLNALTNGKGPETLERINAWALDMPVNTQKAVETFAMMQAMGLDPTIAKMQTLVDVSSIFGEESMPRVARALGQMHTLGKLSAEELNQMSEAGINARKYLTEAFGKTVPEIQKAGIDIDKVIKAIMDGLDRDFGGAARANMDSWQGIKSTTISYVTEIDRRIMAAGLFTALKDQLSGVNAELIDWMKNNDGLIKQKVPEYIGDLKTGISSIYDTYQSMPEGTTSGLIGAILLGPTAGAIVGLADSVDLVDALKNSVAGFQAVQNGDLSWFEYATSDAEELEAALKRIAKAKKEALQVVGPEAYTNQTFAEAAAHLPGSLPAPSPKPPAVGGSPDKSHHTAAGSPAAAKQSQKFYDLYYTAAGPEAPPTDLLLAQIQSYQDDLLKIHEDTNAAALDDTKDTTKEMSQAWISAERNIQSFSANTFYSLMTDNYDNIGKSFADMLLHMVANYEAATMQMALMGDGTSGNTGLLGMAVSGISSYFMGGGMNTGAPAHVGAGGTTAFGMADGGMITEPILGIGASGQHYQFGEGYAPEMVVPMKNVKPAANSGGTNTTIYADMRGASVDAVRRLEQLVHRLNANLENRAVSAVVNARQRGMVAA